MTKMQERLGKVRAVLFDLDGTIVDTNPHITAAWEKVIVGRGGRPGTFPSEKLIGLGARECAANVREFFGWEVRTEELVKEFRLWFGRILDEEFKTCPGAIETIEFVRSHGFKTALVTSGSSEHVMRMDRAFNFLKLFDVIVDAETPALRGMLKPQPHPYQLAAMKLGVEPDESLVFEDYKHGVISAVTAGCVVVGVSHDHNTQHDLIAAGAHTVFHRIDQAIELRDF